MSNVEEITPLVQKQGILIVVNLHFCWSNLNLLRAKKFFLISLVVLEKKMKSLWRQLWTTIERSENVSSQRKNTRQGLHEAGGASDEGGASSSIVSSRQNLRVQNSKGFDGAQKEHVHEETGWNTERRIYNKQQSLTNSIDRYNNNPTTPYS